MQIKIRQRHVLVALAFLVILPAVLLGSSMEASAKTGIPPKLLPSAGPIPADKALNVNVYGKLTTLITTQCGKTFIDPEAPLNNYVIPAGGAITGGAYLVTGGAVDVTSGPFSGQKIPVSIDLPAQDGSCDSFGRHSIFSGSHVFDTSGLANGEYSMDLRVRDELGGVGLAKVSFTVLHPAQPVTSELVVSCSGSPATGGYAGETVITWTAKASGGSGGYSYSWSGTESLSGSKASVNKMYSEQGEKEGRIKVTSGGVTKQASCQVLIQNDEKIPKVLCEPHNFPRTLAGDPVTAKVVQGTGEGPYSWNSNLGDPQFGSGTSFTTRINAVGTRALKVTDASEAYSICFVEIYEDPGPDDDCSVFSDTETPKVRKITVNSNRLTTWALTGPSSANKIVPGTTAEYSPVNVGVYQIAPAILAGYNVAVTPSASQSITEECDSSATFNITYTYAGGGIPPTGGTPTLVIVPGSATTQVGNYTYFNARYDADGSGPLEWQTVTLGSSWTSSNVAVAGFSGTANGSARYLGNGVGTAQVRASYSGLNAVATLSVTSGPTQPEPPVVPPPTTPPTTQQTHSECVNSACVQVAGAGPNRCRNNSDCGGGPGSPGFGGVCDVVQQACVNRVGGGTSCATDSACGGSSFSHLECQNNSCVIVGGPGESNCSVVGSGCTVTGPVSGTCTFSASPSVVSRGGTSNLSWSCDGTISSCTVTNVTTGGVLVSGAPASGNVNTPALLVTTPYSLDCNNGAFTATVRVLSITEVPPQ